MGERPSEYARDVNDWYVEPEWAVEALKDKIGWLADVHDPCCGMGTIPRVFAGSGADLVDRGFGYGVQDYLKDTTRYANIITNPPYGIAQQIIERALMYSSGRVYALVQSKFLSSQKRYGLFSNPLLESVWIFSRRPSMPPGEWLIKYGEDCRGGGSIDFCWVGWNVNKRNDELATIGWIV